MLLSKDKNRRRDGAPDNSIGCSSGAGCAVLAHEFVCEMADDRPFNIHHGVSFIYGT